MFRRAALEPLGADEGDREVDEEPGRHEGAEGEVEGHRRTLLEARAERGVAGGQPEEGEACGEEDEVEHGVRVRSARRRRGPD